MREVAKSVVAFSWAVSLFSAQQVAKLLSPTLDRQEATAEEFDEVSRAVQSHLSDPVARQFRAGDEWQRRLIDSLFDAATMKSLDPRPLVRDGADFLQQSVDTIRRAGSDSSAPDVPAVL